MSLPRRVFLQGARVQGLLVLVATGLVMLVAGLHAGLRSDAVGPYGARIYVDARHSVRHPPDGRNILHHHAYHSVSGTERWMSELRRTGALVHVERQRELTYDTLAEFDVVLMGEPSYEAAIMQPSERETLLGWVADGGGLIVFAPPATEDPSRAAFDRLFAALGVHTDEPAQRAKFNPEDSGAIPRVRRVASTSTAAIHPVMFDVHEHLVREGHEIDTEHGIASSSTDPSSRRSTVAALEHGDGRIVVFADIDAFTNPMLYYGDHLRLARNALGWVAPARHDPAVWWIVPGVALLLAAGLGLFGALRVRRARVAIVAGGAFVAWGWIWCTGIDVRETDVADVFIHVGNGARVDVKSDAPAGHFSLYTHWGKDPRIRPWASARTVRGGYDALVLGAPTEPYSTEDLATIDDYVARGRTVVYLATRASLASAAGEQLRRHFGVELTLGEPILIDRTPYRVHGPSQLLDGIFRAYAYPRAIPVRAGGGLDAVVHLTPGGRHVDDRAWTRRSCVYDLVSETSAGLFGSFVVVAPAELFDNGSLGSPYRVGDEVVQQTTELLIRLLQRAISS